MGESENYIVSVMGIFALYIGRDQKHGKSARCKDLRYRRQALISQCYTTTILPTRSSLRACSVIKFFEDDQGDRE